MPSVQKPAVPEQAVHCSMCGKEIPLSAAVVPENRDLVTYLCGPGCQEAWQSAQPERDER